MIKVTMLCAGTFVNKPQEYTLLIDNEDDLAVQRINEETEKLEQYTIRQLFDSYIKKSSYVKDTTVADSDLFPEWFSKKYIDGTGFQQRIISLSYERVDDVPS